MKIRTLTDLFLLTHFVTCFVIGYYSSNENRSGINHSANVNMQYKRHTI